MRTIRQTNAHQSTRFSVSSGTSPQPIGLPCDRGAKSGRDGLDGDCVRGIHRRQRRPALGLDKYRAVCVVHQVSDRLLKSYRVRSVRLQYSPLRIDVSHFPASGTSRKRVGSSSDAPEKGESEKVCPGVSSPEERCTVIVSDRMGSGRRPPQIQRGWVRRSHGETCGPQRTEDVADRVAADQRGLLMNDSD